MYKIFLTLIFTTLLSAEMVGGIAIIVKGSAITLNDIEKEMQSSGVDNKTAADILIRKKLEMLETLERKINVTNTEIYDEIKNMATKNNMSISDFYEMIRSSNGLSSSEFKEKTKDRLLSQKLYSAIAYSAVTPPSDTETKEYFLTHKEDFSHPSSFDVVVYSSNDKFLLERKIANPMFFSPEVIEKKQTLLYEKISPELASFLSKTKPKSFTQIVPDGKDGFMSFFVREVTTANEDNFEDIKNQIVNILMENKREQVLSDYFARVRGNADIKIIRESKQDAK